MYYITKETYEKYLEAKNNGLKKITLSLDLNKSKTIISIETLDKIFKNIKKIKDKEIYIYDNNKLFKPQILSNNTFYSLALDEHNFPTLYINGFKMNVGKDKGINKFNENVIKNLKIDKNDNVLEISTGLGYKTIMLSNIAKHITTIEKNKEVIELAKLNPYSYELFKRKNINLIIGDAFDKIKTLKSNYFTKILHDPPSFKLAPDLYTEEFYLELNRVAKDNAKLYHYTGKPGSKYRGKNIVKTTIEKLTNSGWKVIKKADLGIYAVKE